uniref:O-fucosyltransferase family protein n=1 Tax=Nicotiana sylvestris TaxID=4096 RepID=A0A1U7VWF9_NICSY|nr:PREDICTED: uncharacterized protein LOC104222590 [Nicotiana sylvestris]
MIERSSNSVGISIHLRFEEDMIAFSCCIYDGGVVEKSQMDVVREKGWRKKFKQKYRVIAPAVNRINGKCPMTPVEENSLQKFRLAKPVLSIGGILQVELLRRVQRQEMDGLYYIWLTPSFGLLASKNDLYFLLLMQS